MWSDILKISKKEIRNLTAKEIEQEIYYVLRSS